MKLSGGVFLASLTSHAAATAAAVGHVFVFDPVAHFRPPAQAPSLSPEAARLILAHRLGVSQYHSIEDADDEELINHLNIYGWRQELFASDRTQDVSYGHTLVWIEGVDDIDGQTECPSPMYRALTGIIAVIKNREAYSAEFTISNPPDSSANERLLQDMIQQAESLPKKPDPLSLTSLASVKAGVAFSKIKNVHTYNDYLTVVQADKSDERTLSQIPKNLDWLVENTPMSGSAVTVVLMPPASPHSKRSANPYGSYRRAPIPEARREATEALLSLSASTPSSGPHTSDAEDVVSIQQEDDKSAIRGILPKYYKSNATCQEKTRDCSGHGWCAELRKGAFGCKCVPTIVHVGEDHGMEEGKRQVTYWGGPACQKRDISTPFWLFAGSGVLLAFLISAGIGLLYSMGSEELPSVIGAGVSGPVRK